MSFKAKQKKLLFWLYFSEDTFEVIDLSSETVSSSGSTKTKKK